MSGILSRRSLLAGAGYAAAGTWAARIVSIAEAEEAAQPKPAASLCLTMVFMNEPKSKMDGDRFSKTHLPLLRKIYGDSVERIELRTAQASSPGMPPSPVLATSHVWIRDVGGFSQALRTSSADINADLDKTAKGSRISQVDRVVAALGDPLSEVKVGNQLLSTFYPVQAGKDLNKDYFKDSHIPKLFSLYGSSALRRVEGTLGQDQGTAKATYVATSHLYIRDRSAYDTARTSSMNDMIEDAKKFTTIFPLFAELRVTAVG